MDLDRLAKLEWAYLGMLDGHSASPVTLQRKLRDDPEFLVISWDLSFGRSTKRPKPAKRSRKKKDNVHKVRIDCSDRGKKSPGKREGQSIDEKTLLHWTQKARALAERRRLARNL